MKIHTIHGGGENAKLKTKTKTLSEDKKWVPIRFESSTGKWKWNGGTNDGGGNFGSSG